MKQPDTVEIVKQVRLTPKQRLTLMDMANNGGSKSRGVAYDVSTVLLHLGLIVNRSAFTPAQKATRAQKRKAMFKKCITLARAEDHKGLQREVEAIDSDTYRDNETAWFLTPAAEEYLLRGTVTIKTGPSSPPKDAA